MKINVSTEGMCTGEQKAKLIIAEPLQFCNVVISGLALGRWPA